MNGLLRAFATGPDRPLIADQGRIDTLFRSYRMRVMLAITVGYAFAYTCRLALSIVKKPLIDAGIFSPTDLGLIGSALLYSYALGKLVNGFLADHANIRVFFAFGVLVSALINVAMGFSTLLWVSVALWALNGWFQGFGAPSGIVSLAQWFGNRERGRFYGIWSTAHSIGEGLTFVAIGALVAWFGWRGGLLGPGSAVHRGGRGDLSPARRPTADHGSADRRGLARRSLRGIEGDARRAARQRAAAATRGAGDTGDLGTRRFERAHVRDALRDQQLGRALPAGDPRLLAGRGRRLPDGEHARRRRRAASLSASSRTKPSARGARRPTCSLR